MIEFDLQSVLSQIMGDEPLPDNKPGDKIMTAPVQQPPVHGPGPRPNIAPVVTTGSYKVVTNEQSETVEPRSVGTTQELGRVAGTRDEGDDVGDATGLDLTEDAQGRASDAVLMNFPTFTDETIADTLDMRNYATLCRLKVRKWVGRKRDRNAARRSEQDAAAVVGSFSTYKKLFAGTEDKLRAVNSVLDAARTRHYQMTLPWSTTSLSDAGRRDGPRLLANTLFMEYISEMATAKQAMETVLNEFESAYPSLLLEAKKNLGKAFDITQYPPSSAIRDLFALDFDFTPIPEGADYKGLPAAQCAALKGKLDKSRQACMENAMRDVWARMLKVVGHMHEALSDHKKGFHDTLVSNVRELVELLKHLNATKDPRIEEIRTKIEANLCRHEPDVLRKDVTKRALVAKLAGEVLQDMRSR
jgi:hypothetical protein